MAVERTYYTIDPEGKLTNLISVGILLFHNREDQAFRQHS